MRRYLESRRSREADMRLKVLVGAIILTGVERGEFPLPTCDPGSRRR